MRYGDRGCDVNVFSCNMYKYGFYKRLFLVFKIFKKFLIILIYNSIENVKKLVLG